MAMIYRTKPNIRRLRNFVSCSRLKGNNLLKIIFVQIPKALFLKSYLKISSVINGRIINSLINNSRLSQFHRIHEKSSDNHFYFIVMPGILHFLLPSLRLIPTDIPLFFLYNGAKQWEIDFLQKKFPHIKGFKLATLPHSSLSHGDVITLLLRNNQSNFGILDHDLYIFEPKVFKKLNLEDNECMRGIFRKQSRHTKFDYPETFFLFFNTPLLKSIMRRYKVEARLYKRVPKRIQLNLERIGLSKGIYLKSHHNFFDTLHVILALAYSEGLHVGYIESNDHQSVCHVGGTSSGTHLTKGLTQLYVNMRFLEFIDEPVLTHHYSYYFTNYPTSEAVKKRLSTMPETTHLLDFMNSLMTKMETIK